MPETYNPRSALLVVDVQNDFADPEGNLYVAGGEEIIAGINAEITAARDGGGLVVYSQDYHPEDTPHFSKDGGAWPVHCVAGTWGAELHPDLDVDGPLIRKGTGGEDGYSAFSVRDPESGQEEATQLQGLLSDQGVTRLVVCGLAQDVCVKASVLDACRLGYDTIVLADLTRPVAEDEASLREMREAGANVLTGREA